MTLDSTENPFAKTPFSWFMTFSGIRVVADVWERDVWDFQAKSGSSGSCRLFINFLGKIAAQKKTSGKTPASPRHSSSRHPRPSDLTMTLVHMNQSLGALLRENLYGPMAVPPETGIGPRMALPSLRAVIRIFHVFAVRAFSAFSTFWRSRLGAARIAK